jgi:hypothetical protein
MITVGAEAHGQNVLETGTIKNPMEDFVKECVKKTVCGIGIVEYNFAFLNISSTVREFLILSGVPFKNIIGDSANGDSPKSLHTMLRS